MVRAKVPLYVGQSDIVELKFEEGEVTVSKREMIRCALEGRGFILNSQRKDGKTMGSYMEQACDTGLQEERAQIQNTIEESKKRQLQQM